MFNLTIRYKTNAPASAASAYAVSVSDECHPMNGGDGFLKRVPSLNSEATYVGHYQTRAEAEADAIEFIGGNALHRVTNSVDGISWYQVGRKPKSDDCHEVETLTKAPWASA